MRGILINRGLLVICLSFGFLSKGSWGGDFESYSVPAASAIVCRDVGSLPPEPCVVDVDNTSEGAVVGLLVASAHANAWKDNGWARALGFDGTAAVSNGWMLATLRAASSSGLPPELEAEGGKVTVKMTGSAQGTATARPGFVQVRGMWTLEIGPPAQTQVWSDGTSNNYGGATIGGGPMLLTVGGTSGSFLRSTGSLVSYEGGWCFDYGGTDTSCNSREDGALGSGLGSFERSVTIRMPIGQTFLVWWHAESYGDAMAVVDPVLTVHPDDAPYVTLEVNGIEPPIPAPAPLDGVDIDALAARGYNVELLRALGLLRPPPPSNAAPVADPGPDQAIVQIGATVHLDGSQSYDPDGDPITYSWAFTSKPASSSATLNGATTPTATFVADVQGTYIVQLVVNDPSLASTPKTVTASFNNVKPVADAGTGQLAIVGDLVMVNGSGSSDANLDPLTYQWSFVTLPLNSLATLTNPGAVQTTFVPDKPGTYGVQLIVNDGFVNSDPSTVQVQVPALDDRDTFMLLRDEIDLIASLDPLVFKNSNLQNSLIKKLQAVMSAIQSNDYEDAVLKLQTDVAGKTDGCAVSGAPDRNDWITTCGAQQLVYTNLMKIIEMLM